MVKLSTDGRAVKAVLFRSFLQIVGASQAGLTVSEEHSLEI
jgi:hypothetical protein